MGLIWISHRALAEALRLIPVAYRPFLIRYGALFGRTLGSFDRMEGFIDRVKGSF